MSIKVQQAPIERTVVDLPPARRAGGHRFVVVSNRLPVERVDGRWKASPGGLVRALGSLQLPDDALWVGWTGEAGEPQSTMPTSAIPLQAVTLTAEQVLGYYETVCNGAIWPLYHDAIRTSTYDADAWIHYRDVNHLFATAVAKAAAPQAVVWVHDYHLQLLPGMLREMRPDLRIGFFFHIPFPPQELFMRMPWREEVLNGLLGADLVGFQRRVAADNFLALTQRLVGAEAVNDTIITADGRRVGVGAFPISIDFEHISTVAARDATADAVSEIRARLGHPAVVLLGVDRLDYTKGIVERLAAFRTILANRAADQPWGHRPELVLVQVAVPSRERVDDYLMQRQMVEQMVGSINGDFATLGFPAVHYLHRSLPLDDLIALYRAADVMLVTPLRDGMNLVAKEFVAASVTGRGVLVLSEFAGAIDELVDAVVVNPHDPGGLVTAVEEAIAMPVEEAHQRMSRMREALAHNDVRHWAEAFLDRLNVAS